MAVDPRSVKIQSPCPTDLDPDRHKAGKTSWYCGHCEKSVHILSNMTERDARKLMADKTGEKICISYAIKADGAVRFKPDVTVVAPSSNVVPVSALTGGRKVAAAAAVGFSAALAACTPHGNPDVKKEDPVEIPKMSHDEVAAGGMEARPIDEPIVDGGMEAVQVDEPIAEGEIEAIPMEEDLVDGEAAPDGLAEPCDKSKTPDEDEATVRGEMAPTHAKLDSRLGEAIAEPIEPDSIPKPGGMIARPLPPE